MAPRDGPAPADILALVLSPVLIMALVGSLVFFLLEVVYAGAHPGRMQWLLFFFVFGAVLVARVALLPEIALRAYLYGPILGVVAWLALQMYVQYPPHLARSGSLISLGFIVLILWSTNRLTRDCTSLEDGGGEGILDAAGLDDTSSSIERYKEKHKDEDNKRRTPGVWVIWFSLAALPLFGMGQTFIPPEEVARRRYTFWLMVIYTGSGLGLLLTTSFLGLRLYLRRRNLRMPMAMTAVWLTLGSLLLATLLVVGALLPRPNAETKLFDIDLKLSQSKKKAKDKGKEGDSERRERDPSGEKQEKGEQGKGDGEGDKDASSTSTPSPPPPVSSLDKLLSVLKWIVLTILAMIVLVVVGRAILRHASGFSSWARDLLQLFERLWTSLLGLFGMKREEGETTDAEGEAEVLARQPFESFDNPFADGRAGRMSLAELIRYSFAALEAWARDRQLGRQQGETALELAARLGEERPPLEEVTNQLALLYVVIVYGKGNVPTSGREVARRFWETLSA